MILNEEYTKKYCASFFGPTASKLEQVAFSQYIVDGYLQKHLRKLVREYREKHLYLKSYWIRIFVFLIYWMKRIWRIGSSWMWIWKSSSLCVNPI